MNFSNCEEKLWLKDLQVSVNNLWILQSSQFFPWKWIKNYELILTLIHFYKKMERRRRRKKLGRKFNIYPRKFRQLCWRSMRRNYEIIHKSVPVTFTGFWKNNLKPFLSYLAKWRYNHISFFKNWPYMHLHWNGK